MAKPESGYEAKYPMGRTIAWDQSDKRVTRILSERLRTDDKSPIFP